MVVKQGDIIKINFNPQKGHEEAGFRPAVIISNNTYNSKTNLVIACPISNTPNKYPLHVPLDDRTMTTGSVLCQHIRTLDINARDFIFIEKIPLEILEKVISIVKAEINY